MNKKEKIKFVSVYNDIVNYPTLKDVGRELGLSESSVRRRRDKLLQDSSVKLIDRGYKSDLSNLDEKDLHILQLKKEISSLRKQLSDAHDKVVTGSSILELIHDIEASTIQPDLEWLKCSKDSRSHNIGIPVLFLSDIHFDEVVVPEQISYLNQYNRSVAISRIQRVFEKSVDLLKNHLSNAQYEGIVLPLGGDLISGNIHDELAETNEYPILDSVVTLTEYLISGVEFLHQEFGKVYIPCVVGNHGRLHQKKRFKNKAYDNYEFIIYHYIKKYFQDNPDIEVEVSESTDIQFPVYDKHFLLTHGDQFRGGNGISGIFSPLMLGYHRKNARQSSVGKPFDVLLVGHFHQLTMTEKLIINGSIKGYDEYAADKNLSYEPPQQALFIVHPKHGITFRIPVLCDG